MEVETWRRRLARGRGWGVTSERFNWARIGCGLGPLGVWTCAVVMIAIVGQRRSDGTTLSPRNRAMLAGRKTVRHHVAKLHDAVPPADDGALADGALADGALARAVAPSAAASAPVGTPSMRGGGAGEERSCNP